MPQMRRAEEALSQQASENSKKQLQHIEALKADIAKLQGRYDVVAAQRNRARALVKSQIGVVHEMRALFVSMSAEVNKLKYGMMEQFERKLVMVRSYNGFLDPRVEVSLDADVEAKRLAVNNQNRAQLVDGCVRGLGLPLVAESCRTRALIQRVIDLQARSRRLHGQLQDLKGGIRVRGFSRLASEWLTRARCSVESALSTSGRRMATTRPP